MTHALEVIALLVGILVIYLIGYWHGAEAKHKEASQILLRQHHQHMADMKELKTRRFDERRLQ